MQTRIQKWGNSLALRIPKAFAVEAHLEEDALVDVALVEGQIVVKPVQAPNWTLDELLAGVTPDNIHHEIEIGPPVGKELCEHCKTAPYAQVGVAPQSAAQSSSVLGPPSSVISPASP